MFQSAVRISVWLKIGASLDLSHAPSVSIRRADLCLVEVQTWVGVVHDLLVSIRRADLCLVEAADSLSVCSFIAEFQSAVRISVWLKCTTSDPTPAKGVVSIRRADLCLVEARNDSAYAGANSMFQSAVRISVWLKLCTHPNTRLVIRFQSAVRISVWLKVGSSRKVCCFSTVSIRRADLCLVEVDSHRYPLLDPNGFNPPCGSLFG